MQLAELKQHALDCRWPSGDPGDVTVDTDDLLSLIAVCEGARDAYAALISGKLGRATMMLASALSKLDLKAG